MALNDYYLVCVLLTDNKRSPGKNGRGPEGGVAPPTVEPRFALGGRGTVTALDGNAPSSLPRRLLGPQDGGGAEAAAGAGPAAAAATFTH